MLGLLVLFFGARKIPELAKGLGSGIRNFKRGLNEGKDGDAQLPPGSDDEADHSEP